MIKDLTMFVIKAIIINILLLISLHFIITNYQIQIFDSHSGILQQHIDIILK